MPAAQHHEPVPTAMNLYEYVQFAASRNEEALERGQGWQGPAFTFTRYMKAHPDLEELSSQESADVLDDLLFKMFPGEDDPWIALLGDCDSAGNPCEPFDHFVHCWDTIDHPLGEAPLEQAVRLADSHPVRFVGYDSPRWGPYRRFISICRWLHETVDDESFFVPVQRFGELLKVPKTTVSNYRKRGVRDGYLVLVKEHEGRRKAAEYRFNIEALGTSEEAADADDWGEVK